MTIKYGVISTADLVDDLLQWRSFYVSGRMQKPVRILKTVPTVAAAATENLRSALAAALLMSPPSFSDLELFMVRPATKVYGTVADMHGGCTADAV